MTFDQATSACTAHQIELFDHILPAYAGGGAMSNADLYRAISKASGLDAAAWDVKAPIGAAGEMHSPLKRRVRWYQQSLRALQLLERHESKRGYWTLTPKGKNKLTPSEPGNVLLGFSTDLGIALWAKSEAVFPQLGEDIHLCLTSLPYVLRNARAYGGAKEHEYVDWALRLLEPIIRQLAPGGSIALNLGQDCFEAGMPSRSLYKERLLLKLVDTFGLRSMDTLIWHNPSRPPGPLQWASLSRQQLNASYESILWLSNDPKRCLANNRRVLQPHSEQHLALMGQGGEKRHTSYGDGAHRVRPGSYGKPTEGRIPRNVITMSHKCGSKQALAALARAAGLPVHGATMPLGLAKLLIEFLTEREQLVVDPCSGWFTTAKAADELGRRWIGVEHMGDYVLGGALGMRSRPGFQAFGDLASTERQLF